MPDHPYKSTVLDNGLRIVSEKMPYVRSVSIGIWVKLGSRMEEKSCNGISHFIEHMLFRGTDGRKSGEIARDVDSLGAQIGASTNREYTCVHARALDEHLPEIIRILADIMLNSTFSEIDIEREKKVVLEEIKMMGDSPDVLIHELYSKAFWKEHPLGRPIVGTSETVLALTREKILDFFRTFYSSNNTIITISGNVCHEHVVDILSKYFGKMKSRTIPSLISPGEPKLNIEKHSCELGQVHICLGTKGISQKHEDRFSAYLIDVIMGSGISSRLFQNVRSKKGLCYSIYSYFTSFSDSGTFAVCCATSSESAPEVISLILHELRQLKEVELAPEEMRRNKERLKGNLMLNMENTNSRMIYLAKQAMYFGKYCQFDAIIDEINRITPHDIIKLSRDLFRTEFLNLVLMGDLKSISFQDKDLAVS